MDDKAKRLSRRAAARTAVFPETVIDDFSRVDSAVEFYTRVNALLRPESVVVDFGAGRGHWCHDDASETRRQLRMMRGRASRVIGLDVDPVVQTNPSLDEAFVLEPDQPLPLPDQSVDLVVSDFTFEHIDDPEQVASELDRILRPGGWICARTPNKRGYIGVGARLVPNRLHTRWLARLQPGRKGVDVFPTRYNLNTAKDIERYFPSVLYEHVIYTMPGEPLYAGSSPVAWRAVKAAQRFQPQSMEPMLLIFLRRRPAP